MSSLRDLSLVVVDGDSHALGICETLLKGMGVDRLRLFTDPNEAIASIKEHPPSLILAALEMRAMNGFKLAETLRAETPAEETPIPLLLMAKESKPELIQHAKRVGIDDYLIKPLSARILSQRLTAVLQRRDIAALTALEGGSTPTTTTYAPPGLRLRENFGFANAEAVLAGLRRRFGDGLVDQVDMLRSQYQAIETAAKAGKAAPDALRDLHQRSEDLRGIGPEMGFPLIGKFSDQLSELTAERETLNDQELRLSLALIDAMAEVAKSRIEGDGGAVGQNLLNAVTRTMNRMRTEA
ncbi:MAG: response regulator [Ferrovibrionaceae bacterium]